MSRAEDRGWVEVKHELHYLRALLLLLTRLSLLRLTQLFGLSEDLAAFPDAGGNHPDGGPGSQPAVTWGTQRNPLKGSDAGSALLDKKGERHKVSGE